MSYRDFVFREKYFDLTKGYNNKYCVQFNAFVGFYHGEFCIISIFSLVGFHIAQSCISLQNNPIRRKTVFQLPQLLDPVQNASF